MRFGLDLIFIVILVLESIKELMVVGIESLLLKGGQVTYTRTARMSSIVQT